MTRLVHLSDLHFGAVSPGLAERLVIQLRELGPDLIVISGDLTQRARSGEFREAAAFLAQLPGPQLVVPGNHDLASWRVHERLAYPWRKWQRYISPDLEPCLAGEDFLALGLNSARVLSSHLDWSRGRINERQLRRIEAVMSRATPDQIRLVVTHHPFALSEEAAARGLIGRHALAWPRLQAAGVDMILSGHIHLAYARLCKGMIVAHAGSGISHRLKGQANSFNLIDASRARVIIQQLEWRDGRFVEGPRQIFERGEAGYAEVKPQLAMQP